MKIFLVLWSLRFSISEKINSSVNSVDTQPVVKYQRRGNNFLSSPLAGEGEGEAKNLSFRLLTMQAAFSLPLKSMKAMNFY
jgi:hypothetical protein